jgi:hypothetical protein
MAKIRTVYRHVITSMVAVLTLLACAPTAHAQWSGWAQCRIRVEEPGRYSSEETQTWIVTNVRGNTPADFGTGIWHASGKASVNVGATKGEWAINGSRTDMTFAVVESGGTRQIQSRSGLIGQSLGTAGYIEGMASTFARHSDEWAFPPVQGSASASTLANNMYQWPNPPMTWGFRPASVNPTTSVECSWDFVNSSTPPAMTPTLTSVCVPFPRTTVRVWMFDVQSAVADHPQAQVTALNCYKLIGGGVRSNWRVHGSLLTATAPGGAPSGAAPAYWSGRAKDHFFPDPTTISVFGIGLYDAQDAWEVAHWQAMSVVSSSPVVQVTVPAGYAMTGGGCFVEPTEPGVLLEASFPVSNTTWECRARAHIAYSEARLTAYVVGIRPRDSTKPLPTVQITSGTSVVGSHVYAFAAAAAGHLITGGGAAIQETYTLEASTPPLLLTGQRLTGSYPDFWPLFPALESVFPNIWRASSKDHIYPSKASVRAYAVNVKFN